MKACFWMSLVGMLTTGLNSLQVADMIKSCEQDESNPARLCFGWNTPEAEPSDPCNQKVSLANCKYAFASVTKLDEGQFLVQLAGKAKNGSQAWVGIVLFGGGKVLSQDMSNKKNGLSPRLGFACISDDSNAPRYFDDVVRISQRIDYHPTLHNRTTFKSVLDVEPQQPGWTVCQFKMDLAGFWDEIEDRGRKERGRRYEGHKVGLVGNLEEGKRVEAGYRDSISPAYFTSSSYAVDIFTSSASENERRGSKFVIQVALLLLVLVPVM